MNRRSFILAAAVTGAALLETQPGHAQSFPPAPHQVPVVHHDFAAEAAAEKKVIAEGKRKQALIDRLLVDPKTTPNDITSKVGTDFSNTTLDANGAFKYISECRPQGTPQKIAHCMQGNADGALGLSWVLALTGTVAAAGGIAAFSNWREQKGREKWIREQTKDFEPRHQGPVRPH
jgi:hypothetical protein